MAQHSHKSGRVKDLFLTFSPYQNLKNQLKFMGSFAECRLVKGEGEGHQPIGVKERRQKFETKGKCEITSIHHWRPLAKATLFS